MLLFGIGIKKQGGPVVGCETFPKKDVSDIFVNDLTCILPRLGQYITCIQRHEEAGIQQTPTLQELRDEVVPGERGQLYTYMSQTCEC